MFFFHWRGAEAGSRPAAGHFLLLRQKKLTKEKATRQPEALRAPLRYSQKRGPHELACGSNTCGPDPLLLRSSLSRSTGLAGSGATTASQGIGPSLRSASNGIRHRRQRRTIATATARNRGLALSGRPSAATARHPAQQWLPPHPQVPLRPRVRSGAKADQGRMCLSRRRVRADPAFASTAACPEGDSDCRVAFSFVSFFWRSKRK